MSESAEEAGVDGGWAVRREVGQSFPSVPKTRVARKQGLPKACFGRI